LNARPPAPKECEFMRTVAHGDLLSGSKRLAVSVLALLSQTQCASVRMGVSRVHFAIRVYIRVYAPVCATSV
jgi:hypothetical protein